MKKVTILILLFLFLITIDAASSTYHLRGSLEEHQRFGKTSRSSSKKGGGAGVFGFILGPILFFMAFPLIWYNEKKAAIDYRRLQLAKNMVEQVNPFNRQQVVDANGKLIHVTGDTATQETVVQNLSGISLNNVVKIVREVQVKEWRARQTGDDNNRHWQYDLIWASDNIQQAHDRYNDPSNWFIQNQTTRAQRSNIGNYFLNQNQIDRLSCSQTFQPQMNHAFNIGQRTGRAFQSQPEIQGEYIYFPSPQGGTGAPGALRVKFQFCPTGPISIIARSKFESFEPFRIDIVDNEGQPDEQVEIDCCCTISDCIQMCVKPITQIDLITQEKVSYQEMMDAQMKYAKTRACIMRFVGYFMMVFGICLLFSPITTLLGYIPFVGGFLKGVVGFVIFLAALIICLPIFILTLGFSWICFHPKVGIAILVVGAIVAIVIIVISSTSGGGGGEAQKEAVKHMGALVLRPFG